MYERFIDEIRAKLPELRVLEHELMKNHTTFRVGGPADLLVSPSIEQMAVILRTVADYEIPVVIIGNGSNLLVGDEGIRGLVIEIGKEADDIAINGCRMKVSAGTLLSKAANAAASAGLGGMEFAAGIPGSVGGAVVMNAGAYGGEMKDILISADVMTKTGEILTLTKEELDLSYRHSCITERDYIVTGASFLLEEKPEEEIRAVMADLKEKRVSKQPLEYPSAGSTFKRPEGYFAGKLIQDAGLRGYTVGGAQVSEKHCGFVINKGDASAADILHLIRNVQKEVQDQFGVRMETEVRMLGEF